MIWFTIALFVVSFLVTALLAPKPDIENARAGALDDVSFPMASEDAPIPLVLGKVRLNGPNTLWYGDFEAVPIREKIKTGLFSSTKVTVGHKYYLGLHLGLALGPGVQMTEIFIDEESVWTGSTSATAVTTGSVDKPTLFGGYKEGGGWSGNFSFYPGTYSQPVNAYLEGQIGAGDVPAYRGMANLVWEKAYIGESNQLRKMAFALQKYTNSIGTPNSGKIGDDMNPMEALYQILTDEWIGLGITTALIDVPSLVAAGTILYNEGNGVSVIVTSSQSGKQIITEILRQVDGIMYQDPETGKLKLKLVRQDYDVGTLPEFDENDILQIRNFTKTAWEDVVAQVKVSFPQREKESSAVAISQDMATANMIGRMKTVTMSFPFCYSPSLAADLASRERSQQSVPLFRMTIEMNRNGYTLRPGDVFKMSWPEYGLDQLVMRVQKHDLGELLNNKIVVDAIQDAFAVGTTIFAEPENSGWTEPVTQPLDIAEYILVDMPTFFARKIEYPVPEGYSQPFILPVKPQTTSSGYTMFGGLATGELDIVEPDSVPYPVTAVLTSDYLREAGQVTGIDATGFSVNGKVGTFTAPDSAAQIASGEAGILYIGGEYIGFLNVSQGSSSASFTNVYRGLFGSSVKDHAAGTRVYEITADQIPSGIAGSLLEHTDTWYYKELNRVGALQQDLSEVTESTFNPSDVMLKPMRVRNLQLDGSRAVATLTTAADLDVSGVTQTRETGTSYPNETEAGNTLAEPETYDVAVYFDGVLQAGLSASGVVLPHTIPFSSMTTPIVVSRAEVRVTSRKANPLGGANPDYLSDGYATLSFSVNVTADNLLLSGDQQSGTDKLLLSGDEQSGGDAIIYSGDEA